MPNFWRRSHQRTNAHGTTFAVRGHGVDAGDYAHHRKGGRDYVNGSLVWQFACPTCGRQIWFYKNVSGAKVWFDSLGKPWPKHACAQDLEFDWDARAEETRRFIEKKRALFEQQFQEKAKRAPQKKRRKAKKK